MKTDTSEVNRLKRNLFFQLALIGLLPLAALVFMTLRVGSMADGINNATSIETLARSARAHYKSFVEGVLEAVDVGMLSAKSMEQLESTELDMRNLQGKLSLEDELNAVKEMDRNLLAQLASLRTDKSIAALMLLRKGINDANASLDKTTSRLEEESRQQVESLISTSLTLRYTLFGLVVFMLIFWVLVVRYLIQRLTMPLETSISFCREIASGQLVVDAKRIRSSGDIGGLIANIEIMRSRWAEVVAALRDQTKMMWQSSHSLTRQVSELEENANHQSVAASSIATTVEEMCVSMDTIAEQAKEASSHADAGGKVASSSMVAIGRVRAEVEEVASMIDAAAHSITDLDAKAAGIGGIITVISDVAEQTNLLALNAAIEAARAGDAGRGFAVVADEVRKLADRTNRSTQSIASMITEMKMATRQIVVSMEASVERVRNSVELSQEAALRMKEVQDMSSSIAVAIDDVDHALRQQRQAALEIEKRIRSIVLFAESHVDSGKTVSESALMIENAASSISDNVAYFKV